jgi:hypothetical protein
MAMARGEAAALWRRGTYETIHHSAGGLKKLILTEPENMAFVWTLLVLSDTGPVGVDYG